VCLSMDFWHLIHTCYFASPDMEFLLLVPSNIYTSLITCANTMLNNTNIYLVITHSFFVCRASSCVLVSSSHIPPTLHVPFGHVRTKLIALCRKCTNSHPPKHPDTYLESRTSCIMSPKNTREVQVSVCVFVL